MKVTGIFLSTVLVMKNQCSQHIYNSIIPQPVLQVIDQINTNANVQEFSVACDTQTNLYLSIQHGHQEHACHIGMGLDEQPWEESTSSVPITGNEPVTILPPDEENNKNKINNGNWIVIVHPTPNNFVDFNMTNV